MALWAIACFCFFQFWYPYHFFFQEQNQIFLWSWEYISTYFEKSGGLARLIGDFLTQFYFYLYAGSVILTLCLLLTGTLLYKALKYFRVSRSIALLLAVAVMTFVAVCHFSTSYRLSSTISVMGWMLVIYTVSIVYHRLHNRNRPYCLIVLVVASLPAYLLFGLPHVKKIQAPDFILEKDFAVDCEYYFGNHDKVIKMVEGSDRWTDQMLFFYNLVQAQRGELPDHLLKFTNNILGTFYQIGSDTPMLTIRNMNELYWALGDMTFTERAAMMTNVFSNDNRNVRMMRRLQSAISSVEILWQQRNTCASSTRHSSIGNGPATSASTERISIVKRWRW